jgi:hypothetical protein
MDRHDIIDTYLLIENHIQNERLGHLEAGLEETRQWQTYEARRTPPQRIIIDVICEQFRAFESQRSLNKFLTWASFSIGVATIPLGFLEPIVWAFSALCVFFFGYGFLELCRARFVPKPTYCMQLAKEKLRAMINAGELDSEAVSREMNRELAFVFAADVPHAKMKTVHEASSHHESIPISPLVKSQSQDAPPSSTGAIIWKAKD